jgi:hypothetical protein
MKYGLDVVIEVGKLAFGSPMPGERLMARMKRDYNLSISLATVYRHKDIYEAICTGIIEDHTSEIVNHLKQQPAFVLTIDAIEYKGGSRLYRAVDFLSGFCLGTLLVPKDEKARITSWRKKLFMKFGLPDCIVTDGEAALHHYPEAETTVPHQDCWYHVLNNIRRALMEDWVKKAKKFLQKSQYRVVLNQTLLELENSTAGAWPPHGQSLRALIEFFLSPPAGVPEFEEPMFIRFLQFKEAWYLLGEWRNLLLGDKWKELRNKRLFEHYKLLKQKLPYMGRVNYLQHELFTADPFYLAFIQVKKLVETIWMDEVFRGLLKEYKKLKGAFQMLRSWLLETTIRRNQQEPWLNKRPETIGEKRLQDVLRQSTSRIRKELAKIPSRLNVWEESSQRVDLPLKERALHLLQLLMKRWKRKGVRLAGFLKAATILKRHSRFLLTFLEHAAIPVSNQALETDNGQLKQLWRLSSGCRDKPYTLEYHGHSSSMTRNCYQRIDKKSPLEMLGFTRELIEQWYHDCSRSSLKVARQAMELARQPRRLRLKVTRESLREAFKESYEAWLSWIVTRLEEYLRVKKS